MYNKTNKGFQLVPAFYTKHALSVIEVKKTTPEEESYPDYVIMTEPPSDGTDNQIRFLNRTIAESKNAEIASVLDDMFGQGNYDINIVNEELIVITEPDGAFYPNKPVMGILDANVDTDKYTPNATMRGDYLFNISHQYIEVRVKNKLKPSLFKAEV